MKRPNRSRSLAERKNPELFNKLKYHDRDWLYSEPKMPSQVNQANIKRVDWATRDEEWSPLLQKAATEIKQMVPLKRAWKAAIITKANLNLGPFYSGKLNYLPKCRSVLKESTESSEDYCERRMRAAAKQIVKMNKTPKPWLIIKLAHLNKVLPLTPRLQATLQRLVESPDG